MPLIDQIRDARGRFAYVGGRPRKPKSARNPPLIPHFLKHDQQNLTAANARLAELKLKEASDRSLVTPPEELPSWPWFNPRKGGARRVTNIFCNDPEYERSALGGWEPRGGEWIDPGHCESPRGLRHKSGEGADCNSHKARIRPSEPIPFIGVIFWHTDEPGLPAAARAIAALYGCRYPMGGMDHPDFHFCNKKRVESGSYCAEHGALCEFRK
jgi:hypothetical protein